MGHPLLIDLSRLPTPSLSRSVIICHLDYAKCKTKKCCRSIDDYCQDVAGSAQLFLFSTKVANTMIIYNHD
jgi:hypothetical protein